MNLLARSIVLVTAFASLAAPVHAEELRTQIKEAYRDRIKDLTSGIYCKAFSCEFDIERINVTEATAPATYRIDATGWLKGTVPGLRGSAKRTIGLTANYTKGTCIIKDVTVLSDVTEDNNGWGASKIAGALKSATIAPVLFLKPDDCKKADIYLTAPST